MSMRLFPHASRIGFGCASLGSRVSASRGLDSLAQAFDADVNWFDLAPSYGDGEAEAIFASFARTRRDRIHICTKCGIAPATPSGFTRLLKPLAQRALSLAPAMRGLAARGRPAPQRLPLTAQGIRESLEASLKRLKTDHVDVYALHDPDPDTLCREEVARALEDVVAAGKARAAGIAGSVAAAVAGLRAKLPVAHIQIPDPPFAEYAGLLATSAPPNATYFLVTHSIFGRPDPLSMLLARAKSRTALSASLAAHRYRMPLEAAARAVSLDRALAANPAGVVLISMFSRQHIASNLARLEHGTPSEAEAFFSGLAGSGPDVARPLAHHLADRGPSF